MKFVAIKKVSVIEMGIENVVYDIELSKNHYFKANDFYTHNCRLRSNIEEANREYMNSFGGGGGISIGSHRVVAVNLPQLAYQSEGDWEGFKKRLVSAVVLSQDILDIHRTLIQKLIEGGRLPLYKFGFMNLKRQFSTIGFIGLNECLELMKFDILSKEGDEKALDILNTINDLNDKRSKLDGNIRNMEQIPGESAAYNFAQKDKLLFDNAKFDIYSNQYIPLAKNADMVNRIIAQGRYDSQVGGGSILHLNIDEKVSPDQVGKLIEFNAKNGVIYFALNYCHIQCSSCKKVYVGKKSTKKSPCHGAEVKKYMRVVGFLSEVGNWSKERRKEFDHRQFYVGSDAV